MKKYTEDAQRLCALADDLCRIYDNENIKRYKRSGEPMSEAEYTERLHRAAKAQKIALIAGGAAVAAGYIIGVVSAAIGSAAADAALSAVLMLCAIAAIYLLAVHPLLVRPYLLRRRLLLLLECGSRTVFDEDLYEYIEASLGKQPENRV